MSNADQPHEAAKKAWAEYFAQCGAKSDSHPDAERALNGVRSIRDSQAAHSQAEFGVAEWREALKELLQQYPDAKITVNPYCPSKAIWWAPARNEATKNRVDGYSDAYRQPTNTGPAMIHREKAAMEKPHSQSRAAQKGRYARWLQQVEARHPQNHARLVADNDRRQAMLLERTPSHEQHLKNLGISDE